MSMHYSEASLTEEEAAPPRTALALSFTSPQRNATSGQHFPNRPPTPLRGGVPLGCGTAKHFGPNAKHDRHHPTGPL